MTILTQHSQIDTSAWDRLVAASPVASWFQSREAYSFFESLSFMTPFVVAVTEGDKLMGLTVGYLQSEGGWLKRRLTQRAIIVGGPLLDENINDDQLKAMLTALRQLPVIRHSIYIETRNLNDYSRWRNTFETSGFKYVPHYNFHIDTTDPEEVTKRMDKSRRRRIRRAMESGCSISNDPKDIPAFYAILADLYQTKVHKPLPPLSMFVQLGNSGFAKYFIVKNGDGTVIGGQLILMLGQRVAYAWYCCGLDKEYHDNYPSILANYAGIRYAADNRFARYDMMGAGRPDEDYGVRDFKAQFGGTLVEHGRFLHVYNPAIYWLGSKAISLINRLMK